MTFQLNFGRLALVLATLIGLGSSTAVVAQTILIDMGNDSSYRGVTVPGADSNGNYWNSVWGGAFYQDIVDISGTPTNVDFGFTLTNGEDSFNGPAGVTSNPPTAGEIAATDIDAVALGNLGGSKEAAMDFYVSSTFQLQGLDLAKTYDLTFFGSHKYNNDNSTRYTIYDIGFANPLTSADLEVGVNDLHNRDTTVTISGISPQADGIIYVGFEGATGGLGYLNALQVQAVPEPASLLLLASAAGLALASRRR